MAAWGARAARPQEVLLNVYDLNEANEYLHSTGFGLYHSGVQIGGKEYTFAGGGGIFSHEPKDAPGARFRCSVSMGTFTGGQAAIDDAIASLRGDFGPDAYHILCRNCNSFSNAFCEALLNKPIPAWVNRAAWMGSWFSCLVPPQMLGQAPVNDLSGVPARATPAYAAFGGSGVSLGGTAGGGASAAVPSAGDAGGQGGGSLTDRREKADKVRQARLAALERSAQEKQAQQGS
ncbi:PPPDE putative peptidase domain-containing protein [Tribonema minus]|uniref:PPPDE putative peptidase domain-containing protein n=1 Tax=Tribonema minus TaxID=303371 RepID=A0A835Z1G9_9STRA|nr:PPPDE putative peptidase domain-containing protein [Tribonema minus]